MIGMAADSPLATRIKRARERRRWTQQQLADRLAVDRKTIDNWENGRTTPRSSMGALEAVLGSLGEEGPEVYTDPNEIELGNLTTFSEDQRREFIRAYREGTGKRRRAG